MRGADGSPRLTRDLIALGFGADTLATLPRCQLLPPVATEAQRWGVLYVLEGAALAHRADAAYPELLEAALATFNTLAAWLSAGEK